MKFEFWIKKQKSNKRVLLPVTPKGYSISHSNEVETVRATAVGDVNILGHRRLGTVTLDGFFTVNDYPFVNSTGFNAGCAMDYVELFTGWISEKAVVRLTIADEDTTKLNGLFYIEEIEYSEDNESAGDINYSLTFREYYDLKTSLQIASASAPRQTETPPKPTINTYTVVYGDCLWNLARRFYGDPTKYTILYEANKGLIGSNPNILMVGWQLKVPQGA